MHGVGRVTSVIPAPVPGATGAEQYPNGHVECPPQGVWNCSFYFNWPFDQEGNNPNNEVVVFQATGGTFLGWSSCPPGHATGNQCRLDGREGSAGLVDCVVAEFQESPSTVTGNCDAEPPPPPLALRVHVVKAGAGSGTVTSFPSGINCGITCQKYFANGSVSLTATAGLELRLRGLGGQGDDHDGLADPLPDDGGEVHLDADGDPRVPGGRDVQPEEAAASQHRDPVEAAEDDEEQVRDLLLGREAREQPVSRSPPSRSASSTRRGAGRACKPGKRYTRLKPGTHTFRVRVGNANGWDASPAVYSWKVKK